MTDNCYKFNLLNLPKDPSRRLLVPSQVATIKESLIKDGHPDNGCRPVVVHLQGSVEDLVTYLVSDPHLDDFDPSLETTWALTIIVSIHT